MWSLIFLFTDLKCSTVLYERVGDLVAYDLVRQHFHVLYDVVAAEAGASAEDDRGAVMATFPTPDRALAVASTGCARKWRASTQNATTKI